MTGTLRRRLALAWLGLLALGALAAPWLPLPDPSALDAARRLAPPGWWRAPFLGTDPLGRDLLARCLAGARVSLVVGLLATAVALAVGVPWGAVAGLAGGRTDRVMMRLADALDSVPLVVVVLFLLSLFQGHAEALAAFGVGRLQLFFVAVGFLFWIPTARLARAETLRLARRPFLDAARAAGAPPRWTLVRHVLPNLLPVTGVMLVLTLPRVVLMEAFLSFLGLGVEPPRVSWGILAAEGLGALNPLVDSWWLIVVPGAFLTLTLWALDGLRPAGTPRPSSRRRARRTGRETVGSPTAARREG